MTNPSDNMSDAQASGESGNEVYLPCERRFRSSNYFLQDQLRCSEAVEDFRSVRNLIGKLSDFRHDLAFQFQTVTVPRE